MIEEVLLDFLVDLLDRRTKGRPKSRGRAKNNGKFQKMYPVEYAAMKDAFAAFKKAQKVFLQKCKGGKKAPPKKKTTKAKSMSYREQKKWGRRFRREWGAVRVWTRQLQRLEPALERLKKKMAAALKKYAGGNPSILAAIKKKMKPRIKKVQDAVNIYTGKKEAAEAAFFKKIEAAKKR